MAIVTHLVRNDSGGYDQKSYSGAPMDFVVKKIPNGVPFKIYINEVGADNEVTEDFESLQQDAEFFIIEGAGGGGGFVGKLLDPLGVTKFILKLISPQSAATASLGNQQGESPNNSLTDRTNKPRPYQRTYDICGTVQSIPNNLMTTYNVYDASGRFVEYGFYCVGRGPLKITSSGITDGDTVLENIPGSSASVYGPYTTPNGGTPQVQVGETIDQGLYITISANEVDGETLNAPNDISSKPSSGATAFYSSGIGRITDATGDAAFSDFIRVGTSVVFSNVFVLGFANLDGIYTVTDVSGSTISVDASPKLSEWQNVGSVERVIDDTANPIINPYDTTEASFTAWVSMTRLDVERILVNVGAPNGMYIEWGEGKQQRSVIFEAQYQLLDENLNPYGEIYSQQDTVIGRTSQETGKTMFVTLVTPSKVRVRVRRVSEFDFSFDGVIVDEIKFNNLYGQVADYSTSYGDITTVHTARRQTARATSIKQPQLKIMVTELLYKYLGGGVFDTSLSENNQAIQSLIRLLRDPIVGGLSLTNSNMDRLLAVQEEIESYFGSPLAGQFCYTFDSYDSTAQDIINTIADAAFCNPYREGHAVLFDMDRPRIGPEMVFTHRSKAPNGEKWTRNFNDRNSFDSLKFSYIDPKTNIKETITIPANGGVKTETYDSKGVRNYQQAYWLAYRRFQRNSLNRVAVQFTAMEEGVLARPGRPISVVKGSRVSPYDGYVVAIDGLTLTLSQNVDFTPGDDHSIILKKRDGSVQSVGVVAGATSRTVIMTSAPEEAIYVGNSALKTEFSFGNEERHNAQMMVVSTIEPGDDRTVKITGYNYTDDYYLYDGVSPFGSAFSNGFDTGFS